VDKDTKKLVAKLTEQGWRIDESGRHPKAYPPDIAKPMVTLSSTPSDRRSFKNMVAELRRSGADI